MDISNLQSNWHLKIESDQQKGAEVPAFQKEWIGERHPLPEPDFDSFTGIDLVHAILTRRSERKFLDQGISLTELGWLLFATQGIHEATSRGSRRTSPSAGARHPFETYIAVFNVEGLDEGIYLYRPYEHDLLLVSRPENLREQCRDALNGQGWDAPVIFLWTAVPYRTHWRYPGRMPKLVALDAGHLCQNLYLACAAIDGGTCAIGAYDQGKCDALLGVDGETELMVYAAPVGKI